MGPRSRLPGPQRVQGGTYVRNDTNHIARRDYLEFFVEEILEYRGNPKRLTTMEFLVKWTAYDASYNSGEPYTNLRKAEPLHAYLTANNLQLLIPKEFRQRAGR